MVFAIVLLLVLAASIIFHFVNPWVATEVASNWGSIDGTLALTAIICGIFFVGIILFMAWALIKYEHKDTNKAHYEPDNKKLEWGLTIITTIGIVALLAPGLVVYDDFVNVPEDAVEVEAMAQQWKWIFRLPGEDGKLGKSDVALLSFDNPLGVDPEDPAGQDDIIINNNEIHFQIDQPVKMLLRSVDVLHDFYVPQFRAKMDLIPGQVTYFWFTPTVIGNFEILCAEFCGTGHFNMRGMSFVDSAEDYQAWLAKQPTFAQTLTGGTLDGLVAQGRDLAQSQGCLACHSTDGSKGLAPGWLGLYGTTAPLTDGTSVAVDDAYLRESIQQPNAQIVAGYPPVMVPYDLSEDQLDALVAYMKYLGETTSADSHTEPSEAAPEAALDAAPPVAPPASAEIDAVTTETSTVTDDATSNGNADADQAAISLGADIFKAQGCIACHSNDGSKALGPTWKNLWGKTESMTDGTTVSVDETYLRESITNPGARVVKDYPPVMQPYPLNEEQLNALVAYARSLAEE